MGNEGAGVGVHHDGERWRVLGKGVAEMLAEREKRREERGEVAG